MNGKKPMLKMENVSKIFHGVKALDKVNIEAYGGTAIASLYCNKLKFNHILVV